MVDVGTEEAICADAASSQPAGFNAKEEPIDGPVHRELLDAKIAGIRIVSSEGERRLYSRDQTEIPRFLKDMMFDSMPGAVVQAETSEAVLEVLKFASSKGLAIIPRGSGSSPFGGSVPVTGGLVLDISRMDGILEIDASARTVTVEAGARWADIDVELGKRGLTLITSPSSKFSTVAGWIATGGIGVNSLSGGHLSDNVLSVEIATPKGELVKLSQKDQEFPLVFGSEGQLGVIIRATLRVKDKPSFSRPRLFIFKNHLSALSFASEASSLVRPTHIIFESSLRIEYTNRMLDSPRLHKGDAVIVYLEDESSSRELDRLAKSVKAREEPEYLARYVWNERFFPMKIRKFGPGMLGLEVLSAKSSISDLISSINDLSNKIGIEPMYEVHMLPGDDALLLCFYMTDQGNALLYALDAVKSMLLTGHAVSQGARPYSVGIWNYPFSDSQERDRKAKLKELKSDYDPRGVMNPGKYFRLRGRFGPLPGLVMSPKLLMPILRMMLNMSSVSIPLMNIFTRLARGKPGSGTKPHMLKITDECAMCGACVSVCPAYLIVKDERVTARGKMLTAKALCSGAEISEEHAMRTSLCMRCKACEQVCQSKLELIPFYEELETELEKTYERNAELIESFVRFAESSPEYDALIERGLVIGAPTHASGGDSDGL